MTNQIIEDNTYTEISPSLPIIMYKAQELFQKGWIIHPDIPPSHIGFSYRVVFLKEASQEPVGASEAAELSFDVVQPLEDVVKVPEIPVKPVTKSVGRPAKVKK